MNTDKKELLSRLVVPVIVSNGGEAHRLAFRLYMKYGVCSMLCGVHKNALDLFDPFCDFIGVPDGGGDIFVRALKDLSDKMSDYILVIIPANDADRLFLEERSGELESFYILASSYEQFGELPPIKFA